MSHDYILVCAPRTATNPPNNLTINKKRQTTTNDTKNLTSQSITNVELEIGGQRIDKQSGQWMEVWAELTQPNPSIKAGLFMVPKVIEVED